MLSDEEFKLALALIQERSTWEKIWPKDKEGNPIPIYCPYVPLQDPGKHACNVKFKSRYAA